MSRRAQGQMGAVMNIGRSRAKVYNTEKPKTTFADVAGYGPVKQEITEVVDFLKNPGKFKEIGARIPQGRAARRSSGHRQDAASPARSPVRPACRSSSVTGSDFMEMFVGVGAARVRDLFQTARKQAPAIIFVDEIDSIGRKRGAGLGGGHDEREQTLNQMLAEMDGFEATEGIVMMAATNRPDVLDPALLRPGRFDRQIMVPLPTQEERVDILQGALPRQEDRRPTSTSTIVARGTPGMSGADLANLVNEAALFAVRRGENADRTREDFDDARDRVLMGLKRPIDRDERGREGAHRVPRGRARGRGLRARARRPGAQGHDPPDRHGARHDPAAAGGGAATRTTRSTSSDMLVRAARWSRRRGDHVRHAVHRRAERPRARHRDRAPDGARVGHVATASVRWPGAPQGAVFLGEDLVHTRDYSDETARVIDEEVERILRDEEDRTREHAHRAPARASTPSPRRCSSTRRSTAPRSTRLVDDAMGHKAGGPRKVRARRRHRGDRRDPRATATPSPTTSSSRPFLFWRTGCATTAHS